MYRNVISLLLISIFVTGCATRRENMPLSDHCLEKPSTVIIAELSGLEKPTYVRSGFQGILPALINEGIGKPIENKLKDFKPHPLVKKHYEDVFTRSLMEKGFNVVKGPQILEKKNLKKPPADEAKYAPYDFRYLGQKYDADYALVLDPRNIGLTRHYHGCIPLSRPSARTDISIYLVNLRSNLLEGYYRAITRMPADGEWDVSPEYDALMRSVKNSLIEALSETHTYFFVLERKSKEPSAKKS